MHYQRKKVKRAAATFVPKDEILENRGTVALTPATAVARKRRVTLRLTHALLSVCFFAAVVEEFQQEQERLKAEQRQAEHEERQRLKAEREAEAKQSGLGTRIAHSFFSFVGSLCLDRWG